MKIYNRKKREWVEFNVFWNQFKEGMKNTTPLQQCTATQFGQVISAIGIIWGIIFSIRIGYIWMGVILIGGAIVLGVQMLGNWQKKIILKQMDNLIEQAEREVEHGDSKLVG